MNVESGRMNQPDAASQASALQAPEACNSANSLSGIIMFCMVTCLQAVLPCSILALAVLRMRMFCSYNSVLNITTSLLVFYYLCIASSACALLCLMMMFTAKAIVSKKPLLWSAYFDHLCCRGFSGSALDIFDFDFLSWAMQQVRMS